MLAFINMKLLLQTCATTTVTSSLMLMIYHELKAKPSATEMNNRINDAESQLRYFYKDTHGDIQYKIPSKPTKIFTR